MENSHAPPVAKIQAELVFFVKYKESAGERRINTIVAADVKINESTSIDLEITLASP